MSNEIPAPEGTAAEGTERRNVPERDKEVVETTAAAEGSTTEPVEAETDPAMATSEPVVAATDPAAVEIPEPVSAPTPSPAYVETAPLAATSAASMQTIYVPAPIAPRKKGNRGIGVLIALASTIIFAGLYAVVLAIILSFGNGVFRFDFFASIDFYIPVIFFFAGFVILVLIVNRAAWWSYVLGSIFVGLFVYFGTIGTGLIIGNVFGETPSGAARLFAQALANPFVIAAALLAREVSMWMGAAISARGRRVKARNAEANAAFERESADRHAEYENARNGHREAVG